VGRHFDGKILRTGRSYLEVVEWLLFRPLSLFGIGWGKRYVDEHTGDPMIFNIMKRIYLPLPSCGNVGVRDIKWRGVTTGCMAYDVVNWKDYLRVLKQDDDTLVLLGVWSNWNRMGGFFILTFDPNTPTD
jgi:hypothetical protein